MKKNHSSEQDCCLTSKTPHEKPMNEEPDRTVSNMTPVRLLRQNEFVIPPHLTAKQTAHRANLLGWWIGNARDSLQLKNRTIDLAIRIFDLYCYKKHQRNKKGQQKDQKSSESFHILDTINDGKLTATTCFFCASKFNQVYPPCLSNFIYYDQECFTQSDILQKQMEIVVIIDCKFDIALITDWFDLYSEQRMPNWAYSCCLYAPFVKSEDLAMAILGVVESTKTKQDPPQYILEVLDRLKIKAPTFLKKARPSLNYEKL